jgi:hypothetical protein
MPFYAVSVANAAFGTTNDALTVTAAASNLAFLHEISVSGEGTASAANELVVNRPGTLGVTPVAIVPVPMDPDAAVFSGTMATGWTTQPVLGTVSSLRLGCNSNGGVYRWVAKPGEEIRLRNNTTVSVSQLSFRFSLGGAQQMGIHAVIEGY